MVLVIQDSSTARALSFGSSVGSDGEIALGDNWKKLLSVQDPLRTVLNFVHVV